MKLTFTIIFTVLFLSCSNQKRIAEFESILGKNESIALSYLVEDFEKNYLGKIYSNLNTKDAYKKFLTDVNTTGTTPNPREVLIEGFKKYEKSKLRLQVYSIPDSIWIENNINKTTFKKFAPALMIKWKSLTNNGTFEYRTSESSPNNLKNMTEDEIIEHSENRVAINYSGSYSKAINAVFNKQSYLNGYFEIRDNSGNSIPSTFIAKLLKSNSDFNDYFIKRIIVIELIYW